MSEKWYIVLIYRYMKTLYFHETSTIATQIVGQNYYHTSLPSTVLMSFSIQPNAVITKRSWIGSWDLWWDLTSTLTRIILLKSLKQLPVIQVEFKYCYYAYYSFKKTQLKSSSFESVLQDYLCLYAKNFVVLLVVFLCWNENNILYL